MHQNSAIAPIFIQMKNSIQFVMCLLIVGISQLQAKVISGQDTLKYIQYIDQDSLQLRLRQFAVDNPMWLEKLVPVRYSLIRMGYNSVSGEYRRAQEAQAVKGLNFSSEGAVTIKDVRLWGRFNYNRSVEDSTRFAHQTRENTSTPWYFGSYGYNHYERTTYRIQARGQRSFAAGKYDLFGGFDYQVGSHFSNNDPRGSIDVIQFNSSLGGSLRIAPTWRIGLEGKYGYGQENVEIAYKNSNSASSAVESPYMNYIIRGYGWKVGDWLTEKSMFYQNDMQRLGGKLNFSWNSTFGDFYGNVAYQHEQQKYRQVLRNESRINELSLYNLNKLDYTLLWSLARGNRRYMASFVWSDQRGKDHVTESANAQNYVYQNDNGKLELSYLVAQKKWKQYYSASIGVLNEVRRDGGTGTALDYDQLNYGFSTTWTYCTSTNQEIEFGLGGFVRNTIGLSWSLPAINENVFHQYVFYHDLLYNRANLYGGNVKLGFKQRLQKGNFIHVVADYGYRKSDAFGELERTNLAPLGTDRKQFNLMLSYGF